MNRRRSTVAATVHVLGAVILLAGIPAGLIWWVGYPLPRHLSDAVWQAWLDQPLTRTFLIHAVACVLWLLWLFVVYTVGAVIVTTVTRLRLPVPRLAVPLRTAITTLFGVSIVASTTALPAAANVIAAPVAPSAHDNPAAPAVAVSTSASAGGSSEIAAPRFAAAGYDGVLTVQTGERHYTVTVKRRDTLWHIAATWLGDPHRWPEIYHLNQHHYDRHGRMHHGNLILPGWVLVLPADATPPPGAKQTPPPAPAPATPHHPNPASPAPPSPTTSPAPGGGPAIPAVPPPSAPGQSRAGRTESGSGSAFTVRQPGHRWDSQADV